MRLVQPAGSVQLCCGILCQLEQAKFLGLFVQLLALCVHSLVKVEVCLVSKVICDVRYIKKALR